MTETPSDARLEQFAAKVAHDLNNLLTGMLGNLELMQNRATRSGMRDFDSYIEGARHAGGRAANFTQRLLAYSGRTAQDPVPADLSRLLREMVESLRDHGLAATLEFGEAPCVVLCDPAQAELALHELMDNAAEAVREGGMVTVACAGSDQNVTIVVADTGTGMKPEVLAQAAAPFFTTRPNGAGKGLGLSIVARFARQAGGTLEIDSTEGQGTRVCLSLPRVC